MAARRKRGDGSLHLRKDGRWEGRYVVGRDGKGFPITKNVLAKTKAECAAKLEQLRENLENRHGVPVMLLNVKEMGLEDIQHVLESILLEFPVREVRFTVPAWCRNRPGRWW